METLLMVVTIVALALAIGMSAVAWRLLREHRLRSAARADALQELAASSEDLDVIAPVVARPPRRAPRFVDLDDPPAPDWDIPLRDTRPRMATRTARVEVEPEIFAPAVAQPASGGRRWLALAVVALLMASVVGTVYARYRPALAADEQQAAQTSTPTASASSRTGPQPIELLSLRHAVDANGAFTITGLIQNPANGQPLRKVVAVVFLFDRDGNYFATGKAPLDFSVLQPGEESPFVVHVAVSGRVSRYRVGFRSDDGGVVAHVDRRGQLPDGTTGGAVDAPSQHAVSMRKSESRP